MPDHSLSDKELVEAALRGDRQAFRKIIEHTESYVAHIVFSMIKGKENREDLAQDIYLKIFHKLGQFRFQARLSTWVAQVAYNTCINYLRKKKIRLIDPANEWNLAPGEDESDGPVMLLMKKQVSEMIYEEMEKLSPVYRTLLVLYHQESCSYDEISTIMNMPEGTVKSYLYRARLGLRASVLKKLKKEAL